MNMKKKRVNQEESKRYVYSLLVYLKVKDMNKSIKKEVK